MVLILHATQSLPVTALVLRFFAHPLDLLGSTIYELETPKGIELTPYDPEFGEQMVAAEGVMWEETRVCRAGNFA